MLLHGGNLLEFAEFSRITRVYKVYKDSKLSIYLSWSLLVGDWLSRAHGMFPLNPILPKHCTTDTVQEQSGVNNCPGSRQDFMVPRVSP